MSFFKRRIKDPHILQNKIEKEIREQVIRRERELREKKEQRLRDQSNIKALQEITEFVPDSEVEKIANEIRKKWESKGDISGKDEDIDREIRESVIRREREIGQQKERKQREQSHLKALQDVTDYVSDEEIQQISRTVTEKYTPKPKAQKRKPKPKKPAGKTRTARQKSKATAKKDVDADSKPGKISPRAKDLLTLLVFFLISIFFWKNLAQLAVYVLFVLPGSLYLIFKNLIKDKIKSGLFGVFTFWMLPFLIVSHQVYHVVNDSWMWPDYDGAKQLIYPIADSDYGRVKRLIENGAKINVYQAYYYTPLMAAASYGNLEIVKLLIDNGANLNPTTSDDETAFMFAVKNEHMDVAYYLVACGARTDQKDINGEDALFYAVSNGHFELTKYLVEQGANLKQKDSWDRNILSFAVYHNKPDIAKYFRDQGLQFERWKKKKNIPGITEEMIYKSLSCSYCDLAYFLAIEGDIKDLATLDKVAEEACKFKLEEIHSILVELGAKDDCEWEE